MLDKEQGKRRRDKGISDNGIGEKSRGCLWSWCDDVDRKIIEWKWKYLMQ